MHRSAIGRLKSRPYKACPILWRNRGWSTPSPQTPLPKWERGFVAWYETLIFQVESCAFCQVSKASKPQADVNPQLPDKPYKIRQKVIDDQR